MTSLGVETSANTCVVASWGTSRSSARLRSATTAAKTKTVPATPVSRAPDGQGGDDCGGRTGARRSKAERRPDEDGKDEVREINDIRGHGPGEDEQAQGDDGKQQACALQEQSGR